MDELKNTPETPEQATPSQRAVSLDEMLRWADQAIDSLENPRKGTSSGEDAPAPQQEAAPSAETPSPADAPQAEDTAAPDDTLPEETDDGPEDTESTQQPDLSYDPYDEEDFDDPEDMDYNDDELLRGYVWDEETGRLYKVNDSARRSIVIPLFLGALLLLSAVSVLLSGAPLLPESGGESGSILAEELQNAAEETFIPADQQQQTAQQAIQYIPAEIISDGDTVAVMASTEAAHALLEDVMAYFHDSVTGEGEKESIFEDPVEVRPLPNGTEEPIATYDELFLRFTSSSSPIKIRTTLTSVETEIIPFDTETEDHPTLIEGTRIVASLGREGSETTVKRTVYINGDRSSTRSGSDTETVKPMDMLIYEGEEKLDPEEDSPGRHEGERGPDQGELTFADPIEGDISCNFGQLYGVLHLGLDYEPENDSVLASAAGTVVSVMERGAYGLMLEIDHGSGFVTRYAHLDSVSVALGDRVEQGQVIATAGSSGNAEEKTLHFEIRADGIAYNPRYYLD